MKCRQHPAQEPALMQAFRLRTRLRVEKPPWITRGRSISLLAAASPAYDASYLWLSRQLGAELITLDRRLAKAAVA
jgi:predicted nucleic acid-binding protein